MIHIPQYTYVYAFDVDHTLEISDGPVPISHLEMLHSLGHIVGICGNFARLVQSVPTWKLWCNFIGSMAMTKADFLLQIKTYVPAHNYYMVGNDARIKQYLHPVSFDGLFAEEAGWNFILEEKWAEHFKQFTS